MTVHVLDADIRPSLYCQDHLVDGFLRPLDLHGDAAVPFVPGSAVQLCGMAGTIAETHTLNPAVEGDVSAGHIHHLVNPVSLCPR